MSKEAMQQHDDEEQLALGGMTDAQVLEAQTQPAPLPHAQQSWQDRFLSVRRTHVPQNHQQQQQQPAVEMQDRTPADVEAQPVQETQPIQQPTRTRWQRFFTRG
jgi:hypothetical protein